MQGKASLILSFFFFFSYIYHSFKTRPGGSTWDPELEPGRVEEKTGEEKTQCDPVKNPVASR
jgi:hypothetical protein